MTDEVLNINVRNIWYFGTVREELTIRPTNLRSSILRFLFPNFCYKKRVERKRESFHLKIFASVLKILFFFCKIFNVDIWDFRIEASIALCSVGTRRLRLKSWVSKIGITFNMNGLPRLIIRLDGKNNDVAIIYIII